MPISNSPSPQRILPQLFCVLILRHFPSTPLSSLHLASLVSHPSFFCPSLSPSPASSPPIPRLLLLLDSIPLPLLPRRDDLSGDVPPPRHLALSPKERTLVVTAGTVTALIAKGAWKQGARRQLGGGFGVTYNCLIDGLCKTYRIGRAHELFDDMLVKGVVLNRVTYNSFIRYNKADKTMKFMREMEERKHVKPTSSSYTLIIHSLCESGWINEARDLLVEMVERGHVPREFSNKLVCGALRRGENLSEEICWKIETGIRERIRQVM